MATDKIKIRVNLRSIKPQFRSNELGTTINLHGHTEDDHRDKKKLIRDLRDNDIVNVEISADIQTKEDLLYLFKHLEELIPMLSSSDADNRDYFVPRNKNKRPDSFYH